MSEAKIYAPLEEKINIWTHLAGVLCAPFALLWLLVHARGPVQWFSCTLYILAMTAMFLGSSMYHAAKNPEKRALLRKFDHASIYFLISGTYTPLMLLCVPPPQGVIILAISWLITAIGIPLELRGIKPFRGFSILMYLLSGWLCVAVIRTMIQNMSSASLFYLISGGVIYTIGVIFYINRRIYSHAIWHLFVIGGVVLQYLAVLALVKR